MSLLETKLHGPRLSPDLIRRERLLKQLEAGCSRKLTLLAAPAGSGKTALVAQWVAQRRAGSKYPPQAWVSLDAEDNDPLRFWHYVMTACQSFGSDSVQPALALLQATAQPSFESSGLDEALISLLNALAHSSGGTLVLEDYHVIHEPQIHRTLAFLIDHLPETLHLLIITRSDPPFSLARLRASGNLSEIRAADLRFSLQEIQLFLQQKIAVLLSEDVIEEMNMRLDGWAAGLRLLSLALQGQSSQHEVERLLTTFAGSNRPLQAYFVSEVLALQPADSQEFLLCTSILGRLTASLCDSVTGRNDSDRLLKALERAGLFLEPLDESGQWYRYHALFAEAMRAEAGRRFGAGELQTLSQRASLWFEQQGMLEQAIEAALSAGNVERIMALIEQFTTTLPFQELHEYHTLLRWLEHIPMPMLKQSPTLCLNYAVALVFISRADRLDPLTLVRVEKLLQEAEVGFCATMNTVLLGELFALRAWIYWGQDAMQQAEISARKALPLLSEDEFPWYSIAETIIGIQAFFDGQPQQAYTIFQKTRAAYEASGNQALRRTITTLLGWVCFEQGQLHLAAEYFRQVLDATHERDHSSDRGHALLGFARIAYEWNDLVTTEQMAQEAYALGQIIAEEECQVRALLLQAQVQRARGEISDALNQVTALLARIQPQALPLLYREVLSQQTELYLVLGDLSAAQRWADWRTSHQEESLSYSQHEQEALLVARLYLSQGEVQAALAELSCLLNAALEAKHTYNVLKIQVLLAQVEAENKQIAEARQRVQHIFSFAHTEGYQRLFLDEGAAMMTLLSGAAAQVRGKALNTYLQHLLQAFAQASSPSESSHLLEPLSPQELRVLRLLATGASSPQIAQELIVSVNTVRTQIQSIYRKLQVNNRVAACETARALQLL